MAAINERYGVAEAVLKSLQAGADVALWITTDEVPAVLNSLEQAVTSGQLSMDRVNESAMRVATSKYRTAGARRPPRIVAIAHFDTKAVHLSVSGESTALVSTSTIGRRSA